MANDSIIEYGDLIGDDGTFDELEKNIERLEKQLLDLAKNTKKAFSSLKPNDLEGIANLEKEVQKANIAEKNLNKTKEAANKVKKKTIDLTNEELIQREREKLAIRERIQRAKQLAIIQKEEKDNIASLRAQLSLATLDWKKLTTAELKNTKEGRNLVKNKKQLTKELKKLEKATGDNRRNVGNYSSALSGLNGVMLSFGGNIGVTVGALTSLKGILPLLAGGFKSLRVAIASTGIGLLVIAFGALVTFLAKTQRGLDFVKRAFAAVSATIDVIIDRISKFGEAIGLAFRGEFAKAADKFKESVSGIGAEIRKETAAAIELEKATQAQIIAARKLRLENAKGQLQIATLLRQAEESKNKNKKLSEEQLREALAIQQKLSDAQVKFAKEELRIIRGKIALGETLNDELDKEVELEIAVGEANKAREDAIRSITRKLNSLTGVQKDNTKEIAANTKTAEENSKKRIEAIESLLKQIETLEANSSTNQKERAFALEELRFKEEQALRATQFKELEELTKSQGEDLAQVEAIKTTLAEKELAKHEKRKNDIRRQFAIETIEISAITEETLAKQRKEAADKELAQIGLSTDAIKEQQEAITEAQNQAIEEQNQAREEAKAKQKKDAEELIKNISDTANKVGELIVKLFEKQANAAGESVTDQQSNLQNAEERQRDGLQTNLAFERDELAKRQSEQQARQKESEQAAKLLTLFNLVSAYAQGGDENALARGLVDFAFLTAISAGFEEGGYTGDNGKKAVAGFVHGQEYVVTAEDTAKFGLRNKKGGEFGEAMGDYFNPMSPLQTNPYQGQKEAFQSNVKAVEIGNEVVVSAINKLSKQMASQPNYSAQIVESKKEIFELVLRMNKGNMTKISKQIIRAKLGK